MNTKPRAPAGAKSPRANARKHTLVTQHLPAQLLAASLHAMAPRRDAPAAAPLLTHNHLLHALSRAALTRLAPRLERVELKFGQVLHEPGEVISHVYFPLDSLVSLLTVVDRHEALEVGMVGHEGMVGTALALGVGTAHNRALVQGRGHALRMTAAHLLAEYRANPPWRQALLRYAYVLLAQVSQTAVCNCFHAIGPRLARWLLMTADRMDTSRFTLTQALLAEMLGVQRAGISAAASDFDRKRLIVYSRGAIHIRDRAGLEQEACVCYRTVRDLQEALQA